MTTKELAKYLAYAETNESFTVVRTKEYLRLLRIEKLAKELFEEKRAKILKETLDK